MFREAEFRFKPAWMDKVSKRQARTEELVGPGEGTWDKLQKEQPLVTPDRPKRDQPGLCRALRKVYNAELEQYRHPDKLIPGRPADRLGATAQALFREIFPHSSRFDEHGRERLILCRDPYTQYPAIFQRRDFPELSIPCGDYWTPVSYCESGRVKGSPAKELVSDEYRAHFSILLGEPEEVNREWLEVVARCDYGKYGRKSVLGFLEKCQEDDEKAEDKRMADLDAAYLSAVWLLAQRVANLMFGSGDRMYSFGYDPEHKAVRKNTVAVIHRDGTYENVKEHEVIFNNLFTAIGEASLCQFAVDVGLLKKDPVLDYVWVPVDKWKEKLASKLERVNAQAECKDVQTDHKTLRLPTMLKETI